MVNQEHSVIQEHVTRHDDWMMMMTTVASNTTSAQQPSDFILFLNSFAIPIIYTCISLVGVIGNSLVIYVIASKRSMRTVTNLLLLNLAIADLSFVVIVPPFTAYQQATSTWPFGEAVCKLFHYLVNVTAYVTVYTLVLISVIRYMTVVHNVRTVAIRTRRNVVVMVAAIWLVVLAVNVPILMSYGVTEEDGCVEYDEHVGQRVFTTFFAFAYLVPLAVIAVFSIAILRHITSQRATSMVHQQQKDNKSRSAVQKVNVSRLLILVIVVFALLWLPVHLHLLLAFYARSWIHETDTYQAMAVIWTSLAYFNSCVNPIIYNRTSKEFRDAFREAVKCIGGDDAAAAGGNTSQPLRSKAAAQPTPIKPVTRPTSIATTTCRNDGQRGASSREAKRDTAAESAGKETELMLPSQPNGVMVDGCEVDTQGGDEKHGVFELES